MNRALHASCFVVLASIMAVATCRQLEAADPTTADPKASQAARRILQSLAQRPGRGGVLIGQNFGHANLHISAHHYRYVQELESQTNAAPVVLSADYGYEQIGPGIHSTNQLLIQHWKRGGLVSLSFHPKNPWRSSTVDDVEGVDLKTLLNGKSAASIVWSGVLDRIADGLEELQSEGVVVLWRPFHEMNGDWFWWGCHHQTPLTRDEFRTLWEQMFNYFTHERQLHNLLWVYSPAADDGASTRPVNDYYPGDRWVDVAAVDFYGDPRSEVLRNSLSQLGRLGKPVALAEFGFPRDHSDRDCLSLIEALRRSENPPSYAVFWHGWRNNKVAIIETKNAKRLMSHKDVIVLKEWRDEVMRLTPPSGGMSRP